MNPSDSQMDVETAATRAILANLKKVRDAGLAGAPAAGMAEIRMWLLPQKSECDFEFDINHSSFESLIQLAPMKLLNQEYTSTST